MSARSGNRVGVLEWVVVLGVGAIVVAIVLGLTLIPRLNDGQKVLNAARPAFTAQRVAGDRVGINFISSNVDMADPIMTPAGGASAEVPKLVAFVSQKTGLSQAAVLAALQKNFPHTTALLEAIPLSAVTDELPGLVAFLSKALKATPAQIGAALKTSFPALAQAIANLPAVTGGWESIPGLDGLTRFSGTPVQSVPDLRTYFGADLIPVLETQRGNYSSLDGTSAVNWIAPLLLIIGIVVILFAGVMIVRSRRVASRGEAIAGASVVLAVGVVVVVLVLVLSLIPRVSNGQKLLDALRPAFTQQRVTGDRAGIGMVSSIADTEDPIMTPAGGAAAEVPKLVAFVSQKTGLSQAAVLAALQKNFPHTTALLEAIPLSAVTQELPGLVAFLSTTLKATPAQIGAALKTSFPALAQAITNLPTVTGGWERIPGLDGLTRFDGTPVQSMPQLRTYLSSDVIPVLETQRSHYAHLMSTSKINFLGWLVLIIGIIVIIYGLLMVFEARRLEPGARSGVPQPA